MAQRAREYKGRDKRKFVPRPEAVTTTFVPRYIEVQYRAIKEVTEVKLLFSEPGCLSIIVLLNAKYNHDLQIKLLMVTHGIQETLKARKQKFYASFGW